ncbi:MULTISPECIES: riboflavin synthase [Sphingobacterium]|jgi:riboflavin synthase|uniref:Riboflavin synthase n=1 Tax=Sphingobacterium multivorum TaxID=28454 RepID=A0A654DGW3_SPHMU|nr:MULTISPECIES: riboflavin synthase [Sphingobacterium]HAE69594.1 riboflavin synthase [Sphingobacterium sp.]OFV09921.1 riboflavin synthase subunit alpha [Sphingobacterium sp. HMSC13C05]QQT45226.1 riboflavin synthase [Sphingobacterium multivorum]SUJ22234.1 Riboflavin synthase alpha chain [Sphingobacterium multivorum]VXD01835.1 Riboflavin synthase alpha chain [Sphingobacterium multivorum]
MFTGIIETLGKIENIEQEKSNIHFYVSSAISNELKIDQSVSHNGVCLTVVGLNNDLHKVTAIDETLQKTNLAQLKVGDLINLERCTLAGGRFDGHIVQGHVDQTARCIQKKDENGSFIFTFQYDVFKQNITVEKGSITVNGISLTVVDSKDDQFSVAIIPYTLEHTNLQQVEVGSTVNLEFDIIGKYVTKIMALRA